MTAACTAAAVRRIVNTPWFCISTAGGVVSGAHLIDRVVAVLGACAAELDAVADLGDHRQMRECPTSTPTASSFITPFPR